MEPLGSNAPQEARVCLKECTLDILPVWCGTYVYMRTDYIRASPVNRINHFRLRMSAIAVEALLHQGLPALACDHRA